MSKAPFNVSQSERRKNVRIFRHIRVVIDIEERIMTNWRIDRQRDDNQNSAYYKAVTLRPAEKPGSTGGFNFLSTGTRGTHRLLELVSIHKLALRAYSNPVPTDPGCGGCGEWWFKFRLAPAIRSWMV
jgi:hypothetical protein